MIIPYLFTILCFQVLIVQSSRELDSLLQEYAFKALVRPRSGIVFDGEVPANLIGIELAALRLRSGSLRRKGFRSYKEFSIPVGVVEQPYVERLVLVYHNLGRWSSVYYPLPGYTFLAPVLGLLAYDATNLSATGLSELDIRASGDQISINFSDVRYGLKGSSPICVSFGLDGSVGFDNVVNRSTCLTTNQGHFSIVTNSLVAPAPAPVPVPAPTGSTGGGPSASNGGAKGRTSRLWKIVGSAVGGLLVLGFLAMLLVYVKRCTHRKKIRAMEREAEGGVALPMARVGSTKAPVASETRTRPVLENEFVP